MLGVLGTLLIMAGVLMPASASPVPQWRVRYLAARSGCNAGEAKACRDSLAALRGLLPGHPGLVVALARACARAGDRAGSLRALDTYARMGLVADPAHDSAFVALAGDSAFQRITAMLEANARPRSRAILRHRLADRDLLAEDVAWDPTTRRWFVSGVHGRRIVVIDDAGHESQFLPRGGERPWGVFALGLDATRRRLWAGTAATPEMEGGAGDDRGRAALVCYDLDRATLLRRFDAPADGREHVFGDLTVSTGGAVYITDSKSGGVYAVLSGGDSLTTLLAPGSLVSPQTPAIVTSSAGPRLVIPDYARGLATLDLNTGRLDWLGQPGDLAAAGIDGLYAWRGGLIAIQNGTEPRRVLRLELDRESRVITRWSVLEQASPELGEPNHGAWTRDGLVLIGNSGWERVGDDGGVTATPASRAPSLLLLPLR